MFQVGTVYRKQSQVPDALLDACPAGILLSTLNDRCRAAGVRLGRVEALGAVERARAGFCAQGERACRFLEFAEPLASGRREPRKRISHSCCHKEMP